MNNILSRCLITFSILLAILSISNSVVAQEWDQLNAKEKKLLKKFKGRWDSLPQKRKNNLRNNAKLWLSMSPKQRQQHKENVNRWESLPNRKKRELKQNAQKFERLPQAEKDKIMDAVSRFNQLSPQEQKRLRKEYQQQKSERRNKRKHRALNSGVGASKRKSDQMTQKNKQSANGKKRRDKAKIDQR